MSIYPEEMEKRMPRSSSKTEQLNTMSKTEKKAAKAERKRIRRSAWVDEDLREIQICKGVTIDQSVYQIGENRYWTLLIKGVIVYLITAGGIGSYLSAMEISFSALAFHSVIFVTALLCACLYHSWKSENIGYLIFFSVYAAALFLFRNYINSGFYAILNDTNKYASIYFRTEGLTHYNERIANRYLAITIFVTLIGIAVNILLNNYILRRARYMIAAFLGVTVNLIPLYMEKEPNLIYSMMLMMGLVMTFILKCGRHFTLSRNDHIFKRRKWGLSYGLDRRSLLQGMLLAGGMVLIMANIVNLVRPRDEYTYYRSTNPYKEATREQVQNLIMLGFAGLWNWYPNNGGLSSGELGGVSTIRLDYQPDLNITFTPYSHDTLYIKNLIGATYVPYVNKWHQPDNFMEASEENLYEAEALKEAYESGNPKAAKGKMILKNIEAAPQTYHPYYTADEPGLLTWGQTKEYTYYPLLDEGIMEQDAHELNREYLRVPADNESAIAELVAAAGLYPGMDAELAAAKLGAYFENEIPYTIRPGATPRKEDFVNYFLQENRKGYCAHFASCAVLAFRYIGIPARYCEGYAISYYQITSRGDLVQGEEDNYDEYYEGYSELGRTALVTIDATDANAHAWAEIYVDGKGWIIAETTPSTTLDEDDGTSDFWDMFNNWFGDGDEDNAAGGDGGGGGGFHIGISDDALRVAVFVVIGILLAIGAFFLGKKIGPEVHYHIEYRRGNPSEKLILYLAHRLKWRKRDKELRKMVNYREQAECLYDRRRAAGVPDTEIMRYTEPVRVDGRRVDSETLEELIRVLEQAGFSDRPISEEAFMLNRARIDELMKRVKKPENMEADPNLRKGA